MMLTTVLTTFTEHSKSRKQKPHVSIAQFSCNGQNIHCTYNFQTPLLEDTLVKIFEQHLNYICNTIDVGQGIIYLVFVTNSIYICCALFKYFFFLYFRLDFAPALVRGICHNLYVALSEAMGAQCCVQTGHLKLSLLIIIIIIIIIFIA